MKITSLNVSFRPSLRALIAVLGVATLLTACSVPEIPGIHRLDIQQGNVVTQDMLARLEPGMTKRRVRFVLGTPLIADAFRTDRWDYVYTFKTGTNRAMQRTVSVFFENDRLTRLEGDIQASGIGPMPTPERTDQVVKVTGPRKSDGLFDSLNPFGDRKAVVGEEGEQAGSTAKQDHKAGANEESVATATPAASDNSDAGTLSSGAAGSEPANAETADTGKTNADGGDTSSGGSWWDRFKSSDDDKETKQPEAEDIAKSREAPLQDESRAQESSQKESVAQPDAPQPESADSVRGGAPGKTGASQEQTATANDPTQADGGFFARIRQRFELPDLPSGLIKAPVGIPEDNPGDG